MRRSGLSQETLKIIACITMLIDHIGSVFVPFYSDITIGTLVFPGYTLRIIGRIAFPIYCFLLAEGAHYTKSPVGYAARLFAGMLLSEIPFDLALRGRMTWGSQSVMVTLLMGFIAIEIIKNVNWDLVKILTVAGFFWLAEWANTDYGGYGVLLMVLFYFARGSLTLQTVFLAMVAWMMGSAAVEVMGYRIPIEMFALGAILPIACYSGRKSSSSKWQQLGFYLFYPGHLIVLMILRFWQMGLQSGRPFWELILEKLPF